MPDTDPPLPRTPDDPEHLRRLRQEAQRRLNEESQPPPQMERISHVTVYGGPPPGFTGGPVTRRWTLRTLLLLIAAFIAGIIGLFFAARKIAVPVYGGPPPPDPHKMPEDEPKPLYGGPPPAVETHPKPFPDHPPKPQPKPRPVEPPSPPAAVYGGPPPQPPGKP